MVANQPQRIPAHPLIEMIVSSGGFDAADDWIVENAVANDIVITTDILLADRCVKKSVRARSVQEEKSSPKTTSDLPLPIASSCKISGIWAI